MYQVHRCIPGVGCSKVLIMLNIILVIPVKKPGNEIPVLVKINNVTLPGAISN